MLCMDGQEVFKFAVRKVPECIHEVARQAGISVSQIDWFLLHQANSRIIRFRGEAPWRFRERGFR